MTRAARRNEARAWRECAKWVTAPTKWGTRREYLCSMLTYSEYHAVPARWPREAMLARVSAHHQMHAPVEDFGSTLDVAAYGTCPQDERNDTRVIFCLLMALECEDEALPPADGDTGDRNE